MERGEAGVTMTNKPVTFFLPSLCLFVVLLPPLAQSKAAVLSYAAVIGGLFSRYQEKNTREGLPPSLMVHHSISSLPPLFFFLWFLVYVALSTHFTDSASSLIKQEAEGMATIALPSASY